MLAEVFTPEAIRRATPAPGQKPVMTMLGGRGGCGKSWLTGRDGPGDVSKTIVIDADNFKTRLPEYQGWNARDLHEESSTLVEAAAETARKLGLNVCFDLTMKTAANAVERIETFVKAGYDIHGFYMFASPETATFRAMRRFRTGNEMNGKGRFVPPESILANTDNEKNFDAAIPIFQRWGVYDNDEKGGRGMSRAARRDDDAWDTTSRPIPSGSKGIRTDGSLS